MPEIEPIRVGVPLDDPTDVTRCAYSLTPEHPRCTAPSVIHVITMDPATGDIAMLYSCAEHELTAVLLGADSHPIGDDCATPQTWHWTDETTGEIGRCTS